MMAKVRFAEKARAGLRGKTTSKVKPKGKVKPPKKVKPAPKKKPVVKAKATAKPKVAAKPKTAPKATPAAKAVAPIKIETPKPKFHSDQPLLKIVMAQLEDAKAEDIIAINLDGKTAIADNMVVASGRSNRHVGAIADQLVEKPNQLVFRREINLDATPGALAHNPDASAQVELQTVLRRARMDVGG